MEVSGAVNVYVCEKCGGKTVTVNRDEGVTPFMLACRVNNVGCGGHARSSFYRVDQNQTPDWEWYRPDEGELATLEPEWQHHIKSGGLKLRKLDAIGREKYGHRVRRG